MYLVERESVVTQLTNSLFDMFILIPGELLEIQNLATGGRCGVPQHGVTHSDSCGLCKVVRSGIFVARMTTWGPARKGPTDSAFGTKRDRGLR
jgi:hypothetical protein